MAIRVFRLCKLPAAGIERVPTSLVKQIAGRAGRRSSQYPQGYVSCLDANDLSGLKEAISLPDTALSTKHAGIFPEFDQIELLAGQKPGAKLEGERNLLPVQYQSATVASDRFSAQNTCTIISLLCVACPVAECK